MCAIVEQINYICFGLVVCNENVIKPFRNWISLIWFLKMTEIQSFINPKNWFLDQTGCSIPKKKKLRPKVNFKIKNQIMIDFSPPFMFVILILSFMVTSNSHKSFPNIRFSHALSKINKFIASVEHLFMLKDKIVPPMEQPKGKGCFLGKFIFHWHM